ncbi:MAG: hypothetical protein QOJ11_1537 [Frankiales bacterium]|nr:hypothetical protein [Frankiales bacterium]
MHRPAQPPLTLWAARTFGTAAHSLKSLRHNPDGVPIRLLVSHVRTDSPALGTADQAFLEPPLTGPAWVGWALEICVRESVDVLWVTREAESVAAAREAFAAVGTRLLLPSSGALLRTSAKSAVYRRAEALGLPTPPWERVVGAEQAKVALGRLEELSPYGVCVKPDTGQGAVGVHRLIPGWEDLPSGVDLPRRMWLAHLRRNPDSVWLALPWMPGKEHSVDTLRCPTGNLLASVVRTKQSGSYEQVASADPELTAMSAALLEDLDVAPLANVQWREIDGDPMLLEVNPRPSGGLFRASDALGVDLLWAAIRLLTHGDAGLRTVPLAPAAPVRTTLLPSAVPMAVLSAVALADGPAALPVQHAPHPAEQLSP